MKKGEKIEKNEKVKKWEKEKMRKFKNYIIMKKLSISSYIPIFYYIR